MDVSFSAIAPRVVADVRPAADAAATARIDRPPMALAPGAIPAPASLSQEALVARSVLDPDASASASSAPPGFGEAPPRVLKPWGVLMLPTEKPRDEPRRGAAPGAESTPGPDTLAEDPTAPKPSRDEVPALTQQGSVGAAPSMPRAEV